MIIDEQAYLEHQEEILMYDDVITEFLEHHGVKGMRWGERRARSRALNKASRVKEKAEKEKEMAGLRKKYAPKKQLDLSKKENRIALKERNRALKARVGPREFRRQQALDIQRARDRFASGAGRADQKIAKMQFKKDKINKGSREARRIYRGKKRLINQDFQRSRQIKDGKELVGVLLLGTLSAAGRGSSSAGKTTR